MGRFLGLPHPLLRPGAQLSSFRCGPPSALGEPLRRFDDDPDNPLAENHYLYAVATDLPFTRANGGLSSVLYLGRGSAARVASLWQGGHSVLHPLARVLARLPADEVFVLARPCAGALEASLLECLGLTQLARQFGEAPPCNARWEGYILGRFLKALAHAVAPTIGGKAPTDVHVYDWPTGDPGAPKATYADVYYGSKRRDWRWSLAWILPHEWGGAVSEHAGKLLLLAPQLGEETRPLDWGLLHADDQPTVEICDASVLGEIEDGEAEHLIRGLKEFQHASTVKDIPDALCHGFGALRSSSSSDDSQLLIQLDAVEGPHLQSALSSAYESIAGTLLQHPAQPWPEMAAELQARVAPIVLAASPHVGAGQWDRIELHNQLRHVEALLGAMKVLNSLGATFTACAPTQQSSYRKSPSCDLEGQLHGTPFVLEAYGGVWYRNNQKLGGDLGSLRTRVAAMGRSVRQFLAARLGALSRQSAKEMGQDSFRVKNGGEQASLTFVDDAHGIGVWEVDADEGTYG